jgi:hypothetical protein
LNMLPFMTRVLAKRPPRQRLRLLAADSETNRALALFSLRLQPVGAPGRLKHRPSSELASTASRPEA